MNDEVVILRVDGGEEMVQRREVHAPSVCFQPLHERVVSLPSWPQNSVAHSHIMVGLQTADVHSLPSCRRKCQALLQGMLQCRDFEFDSP